MDFFARQENARRHTLHLVLLFLAAVVGVIVAADLVGTLGAALIFDEYHLPTLFHQILAATILVAILIFPLRRLYRLRGGGDAIAKMVCAPQIPPQAQRLHQR